MIYKNRYFPLQIDEKSIFQNQSLKKSIFPVKFKIINRTKNLFADLSGDESLETVGTKKKKKKRKILQISRTVKSAVSAVTAVTVTRKDAKKDISKKKIWARNFFTNVKKILLSTNEVVGIRVPYTWKPCRKPSKTAFAILLPWIISKFREKNWDTKILR